MNLNRLTRDFLAFRQFEFEEEVTLRDRNDKEIYFSFLINGNQNKEIEFGGKIGVIVKDWSRSCGYNIILEAERVQLSTGIPKIMLVANQFSATARELAEKLGILTLTIGELISIRSMYKKQFPAFAYDP